MNRPAATVLGAASATGKKMLQYALPGVGIEPLECVAPVFDGGVAHSGVVCGAPAAAALTTSMTAGIDFTSTL